MKLWKKISLAALSALILLHTLSLHTLTVFAKDSAPDDKITVRVGFFQFDGYHEIAEDGTMSGYGYDFLQMIAPYAGFEYEYVGYDKSWAQMQQMLEDGEIDLLTSAHATPERLEKFDFSNHAIGYSSTMLTTSSSNKKYTTGDYSTLSGMRVGMMANNTRNDSFQRYAEKNGFSYVPVYFDGQAAMSDALSRGEIDAMVTSDLRIIGEEAILDKFDEESFYAIVKKGNSELLERLNYAIGELSSDSPSWTTTLSNKYYNNGKNGVSLSFTGQEQVYLNSLRNKNMKLKVLLKPDRAPYSYFEEGQPKGIFADLLDTISARYELPYEVIEPRDLEEYLALIHEGVPDLLFDCTFDRYRAEQEGYYLNFLDI